MTSFNILKIKMVDASNNISKVAVLIGLLKDAYTHEHPPEDTDAVFALSAIQELVIELDVNLFHLLNDENGEGKS